MKKQLLILFLTFICNSLFGQESKPNFELAKENTYFKLINRYNSKIVKPFWIEINQSFIYVIKESSNTFILYSVDCVKLKRIKQKTKFDKSNSGVYNFKFNNSLYSFDTCTNHISQITQFSNTNSAEQNLGQEFLVFVRNHNLYISSEKTGKTQAISIDSEPFYSFKENTDYNYTNELFNRDTTIQPANISWSPDSQFFIALRTDARKLKDNWVINSITEPRPTLTPYKQRNPGDEFPKDEIWIYLVKEDKFFEINLKKWDNENYWFIGWSKYNNSCYIQRINREQNKCDVLMLKKDGSFEVIIEERPGANIYFPQEFLELGPDKYLWLSRRDGWAHFYIYDLLKKDITQLTKGDFTVERLVGIDSLSNSIFFSAYGKEENINPYYRFIYSLNYKSKEIKLLTPENANHEIYFSPDYKYFIDTYSRINLPHKSQLRNCKGDLLLNLESADTSHLMGANWQDPEVFTVKAADSITDLWGVMWKPFDFDSNKKYPIITFVYPGPQDNFVPVNFFEHLNNVHLAQYGFIVVMCDTRGSSYKRSKDFSEYYRTNLRDYPLEDNKYMIEQLIERHLFIDPSKIGIWGGSSGGFMAASAILKYPDFYKVSVSRAGQHEPAIFHSWWSDIFNTPINKTESDTLYSNISIAKNLKGKLFIIHGEADMNVHPANSARLVNELMKQGKYFDYLIVPGDGHGWGHNGLYVQKRIWLYFIENLMNYKLNDINIMD